MLVAAEACSLFILITPESAVEDEKVYLAVRLG